MIYLNCFQYKKKSFSIIFDYITENNHINTHTHTIPLITHETSMRERRKVYLLLSIKFDNYNQNDSHYQLANIIFHFLLNLINRQSCVNLFGQCKCFFFFFFG